MAKSKLTQSGDTEQAAGQVDDPIVVLLNGACFAIDSRGKGWVVSPCPSCRRGDCDFSRDADGSFLFTCLSGCNPIAIGDAIERAAFPFEQLEQSALAQVFARPDSQWAKLILGSIREGSRNNVLAQLAGHLLGIKSLDPEIAAALIHSVNDARCRPPLSFDQVEGILESMASRELDQVRGSRS
jgi:hypothetical protein